MLTQQLINGVSLGVVFALLAAGLSLAYSTGRVVNFAHGDLFCLGAFLCVLLCRTAGLPFILAAIISVAVVGALGAVFSWQLLWHLRTPLERSVATIVLGLGLRDALLVAFGSDNQGLNDIYPTGAVGFLGVAVPWSTVVVAGMSIAIAAGSWLLSTRTVLGLQMRAAAESPGLAASAGIPTRRVQALAFGLAAASAAAGGVILIPVWQVYSGAGVPVGLKAFAAAMLGGFGRARGALVGGLCVGLIEALASGYLSSTWKDMAVYSVLLVTLVVMPKGMLRHGAPRVA